MRIGLGGWNSEKCLTHPILTCDGLLIGRSKIRRASNKPSLGWIFGDGYAGRMTPDKLTGNERIGALRRIADDTKQELLRRYVALTIELFNGQSSAAAPLTNSEATGTVKWGTVEPPNKKIIG